MKCKCKGKHRHKVVYNQIHLPELIFEIDPKAKTLKDICVVLVGDIRIFSEKDTGI